MARARGADRATLLCDTNVLVRFLTADSPTLSPAARRVLAAATEGRCLLVITDVVVAELAYVLTTVYGLTRQDAAERIRPLLGLPGIEIPDPDLIDDGLTLWRDGRIDFADAYLAALNRRTKDTAVLSFDGDIDRIEGVERVDPTRY